MYKLDEIEAEDLAVAALGLPGGADDEEIAFELNERLGVSLEQFAVIAGALMPLTISGRSAITGERYHGFVDGHCFIVKRLADDKQQGK